MRQEDVVGSFNSIQNVYFIKRGQAMSVVFITRFITSIYITLKNTIFHSKTEEIKEGWKGKGKEPVPSKELTWWRWKARHSCPVILQSTWSFRGRCASPLLSITYSRGNLLELEAEQK